MSEEAAMGLGRLHEHIKSRYSDLYQPQVHLSIDECMVKCKAIPHVVVIT